MLCFTYIINFLVLHSSYFWITQTHTLTHLKLKKKNSISANISANTQESTLKIDLWYHCLLIRCGLILWLQLIDFEILDSHGAMWNHTSEGQSWHCCKIIWTNEMILLIFMSLIIWSFKGTSNILLGWPDWVPSPGSTTTSEVSEFWGTTKLST